MSLLTVDNLHVHFHTRSGVVKAVEGVSFEVGAGETLGIAGESGSGKTVAMLSLLRLIAMPPGRIEGGVARFEELDLLRCSIAELRGVRGLRISMIFQDPMTALNPYMRIGAQLMEPLRIHFQMGHEEARQRAIEELARVGIVDAEARMASYPHEFSGGMRQRVMIAMALITRPALLIADEPTTALDVTVQAQILELIRGLQYDMGMAVILITHDLGVIAESADKVLIMYAGRMAESAPTTALFEAPRHPYTRALMTALPVMNKKGAALYTIPGAPPDLTDPPPGCPFAPRCPEAHPACHACGMDMHERAEGHWSSCLLEGPFAAPGK